MIEFLNILTELILDLEPRINDGSSRTDHLVDRIVLILEVLERIYCCLSVDDSDSDYYVEED